MELIEFLSMIGDIAKSNKISEPFIVGGIPRNRVLGKLNKASSIKDVDITTGDDGSPKLAAAVHKNLRGSKYKSYDDGHASVFFRGLHVDFSSNFVAPGVKEELQERGIKNIDSMTLEIYSRDFTMNTLMENLDFTTMYDITGEGVKDLQAGIICCPVDPEITIGVDPRRILRAIKFSIKYGLQIDNKLRASMLEHKNDIKTLEQNFLKDKVGEIIKIDNDKGIDMLIEYKLLPLVPMTKTISDILIQRRQTARAL